MFYFSPKSGIHNDKFKDETSQYHWNEIPWSLVPDRKYSAGMKYHLQIVFIQHSPFENALVVFMVFFTCSITADFEAKIQTQCITFLVYIYNRLLAQYLES